MAFLRTSEEESRRFERRVARAAIASDADPSWVDGVLAEAVSSTFDLVIVRYPSSHVQAFERFSAQPGCKAIFADTLLYFAWDDHGEDLPFAHEIAERDEIDAETISGLIETIFTGYTNHYHANSALNAEYIAAGYAEWAQAVAADSQNPLVVLRVGGIDAAIAVVDRSSGQWDIVLAGVMPSFRGRGVYRELVTATMSAARQDRQATVKISTQSHNVQVIRTWEKLGWRMTAAYLTAHLELEQPRPGRRP